jgi:solute carrier family 35 protein F1/2
VAGLGLLVTSDFIADRNGTSSGGGGNSTALALGSGLQSSYTPFSFLSSSTSASVNTASTTSSSSLTDSSSTSSSHAVWGDILVLIGAVCYSFSNIGQEYLVKQFDWMEFLTMYGILGSVISGIQMAIVEHNQLAATNWHGMYTALFALFSALRVGVLVHSLSFVCLQMV